MSTVSTAAAATHPPNSSSRNAVDERERIDERLRTFIRLRYTLIIAVGYLLIAQEGWGGLSAVAVAILGLAVVSNPILARVPARIFDSAGFTAGTILVDTVWTTGVLVLSGAFSADFFYLYFFILFLAAIGERLGLIALGAVAVSIAYLYGLSLQGGAATLWTSDSLVRVPFLLTIAIFYGYFVERVRIEQRRASEEATVADRERALRRQLSKANRRLTEEVAERARAQTELLKFSQAVEQSASAVLITDRAGDIEYVNPRFVEMTGYDRDRAVRLHVPALLTDEDSGTAHSEVLQALRSGSRWHAEIRIRRKDGRTFWALMTLSPVRVDDRRVGHFVGVFEDVTDRRKAEETLRRANVELQELNEVKSNFVSIVSHELRTPITAIKNSLELLRNPKLGLRLSSHQSHFLEIARRNTDRLADLVGDLLDLSRAEAGRLRLRREEVSPEEILEDLFFAFEAQAEKRDVRLRFEKSPGLPPVWADSQRISQVLSNLVGNAIKFTPEGGDIEVSAETVDGGVRFRVRDTGPGIAPEHQKEVFERFYQVESALTRKAQGSGLGLAIASDLVRAHGSRLELESQPNLGATFSFVLRPSSPRAKEMSRLEDELAEERAFPFFSLLVIEPDRPSVGTTSDRLVLLRDRLADLLPKSSDRIVLQPHSGRAVVILGATDRSGAEVVRRRLDEALAEGNLTIRGPATYPEDGDTGETLLAEIETRLAA